MQTDSAVRPAAREKRRTALRSGLKNAAEHWQLWVMMLPAIVFIFIFAYKPMYGVLIAFKNYNFKLGIMGSEWVGFKYFTTLFHSYWFPIILKNTLTISLLSLVLGFPMPIILALAANEIPKEGLKRAFQTVSYAPHFISTIVMCGMVILFLSPKTGIINHFLSLFGVEPIFFMQSLPGFKWIYVISGIWQGAGWGAIIYFAALSGVDQSLLEAADIDGASRLQKIIYINFPVLVPTIMVMFILQCGQLMSVGYEKAYLLQNNINLKASEIISTYVYKLGLVQFDYSTSTAAGVFNSVVNCIILLSANALSKKATKSSLW